MSSPTSRIIRQLKYNIADYAVTYYKVHGKNPKDETLERIVRSAIDKEEDPFIRACLRKGVRVARAEYAEGDHHDACERARPFPVLPYLH
jgi:hypothetical protein